MARVRRDVDERFWCPRCEYGWDVEGRINAEGKFEPTDPDELDCPECGNESYPSNDDLDVAL